MVRGCIAFVDVCSILQCFVGISGQRSERLSAAQACIVLILQCTCVLCCIHGLLFLISMSFALKFLFHCDGGAWVLCGCRRLMGELQAVPAR